MFVYSSIFHFYLSLFSHSDLFISGQCNRVKKVSGLSYYKACILFSHIPCSLVDSEINVWKIIPKFSFRERSFLDTREINKMHDAVLVTVVNCQKPGINICFRSEHLQNMHNLNELPKSWYQNGLINCNTISNPSNSAGNFYLL